MPMPDVALGLKKNWKQFALLVVINAFVGGMVGLERTVVPLIGAEQFKIASSTLVVSTSCGKRKRFYPPRAATAELRT